MPKFLLAEEPTGPNDREIFIYSPHYLSLVLVIPEDDITVLLNNEMRQKPSKPFQYHDVTFELVIFQNNVLHAGGVLSPEISEEEFLNQAWKFWEDYLIWEDRNIDENQSSQFN